MCHRSQRPVGAVGVLEPLHEVIRVRELPDVVLNPKHSPEVRVKPVVGGRPEAVLTLDEFRREWPLLKTAFLMAQELFDATNPGDVAQLGIRPTFDELLAVVQQYIETRVKVLDGSDPRDLGIYFWRRRALDALENAGLV